MTIFAKWTQVPLSKPLPRSSNSVAVIDGLAFVFGGEIIPRTPIDADIHVINVKTGAVQSIPPPASASTWPAARVGSSIASVGSSLYLWGGRGGKLMQPLSSELYKFDTSILSNSGEAQVVNEASWEVVNVGKAVTSEDTPEDRSYHVMLSVKNSIFIHAGCPVKGRLSALHTIVVSTSGSSGWKALASAPGPARGGTNLTQLANGLLARFGGFAGYELGGSVDLYNPKANSWTSVLDPEKASEGELIEGINTPQKRSVAGFVGLNKPKVIAPSISIVALLFLGEADPTPPEVGHDGAGRFHSDVWGLTLDLSSDKYAWTELKTEQGEAAPSPRGWFGYDSFEDDKAVLFGGLEGSNERAGDAWVLEVVEK